MLSIDVIANQTLYVLYRKGFENMTCTKAELEEAKEDGVKFDNNGLLQVGEIEREWHCC